MTSDDGGTGGKRYWLSTSSVALALTTLLLLVIFALSALLLWQSYHETNQSAEARAEKAAQVVGAHAQWLFEASVQAIRRIDEALGDRPDIFVSASVGDLDDAVGALPAGVIVTVFDGDGGVILTNETLDGEKAKSVTHSVANTNYFQALKGGEKWHITPLFTAMADNRRMFAISRRIERDGKFLGGVVLVIPASLMFDVWRSLNLGPNSSVSLIRNDGWLVAQYPIPQETMTLSGHPLFTEHLSQGSAGSYSYTSIPDEGVERIVGYYRVTNSPLIATAGVSRAAAMSPFWRRTELAALLAGPITAALIAFCLWVATLLRREERMRVELARALEQNRVLFREIHHRVKNNLQTVSALLHLQPVPPEVKQDMGDRIATMAAMHELIYQSDRFAAFNLRDYVNRLAHDLKESHGSTAEIECDLPDCEISADIALPLGLIINEVVSNALKHAFPDGRAGKVSIRLELADKENALLRIEDNGVGFDATATSTGKGSRIIKGLSDQLNGSYAFACEGGTYFTLHFPLAGNNGSTPETVE